MIKVHLSDKKGRLSKLHLRIRWLFAVSGTPFQICLCLTSFVLQSLFVIMCYRVIVCTKLACFYNEFVFMYLLKCVRYLFSVCFGNLK